MKNVVLFLAGFSLLCFPLNSCSSKYVSVNEDTRPLIAFSGGAVLALAIGNVPLFVFGSILTDMGTSAVSAYHDEKIRSREDALRKYNDMDMDRRRKRIRLFIEDSLVITEHIKPGSVVEANVQYTLLAPVDTQNVTLTEKRILFNGGHSLELDEREVERTQGTFLSTIRFEIPRDMPKGNSVLLTTISDGRSARAAQSVINIK